MVPENDVSADARRIRRRSATALRGVLGLALLGVLLGAAAPRTCALYALGEGSEVVEGCFDPCQCPIRLADDLRGFFVLWAQPGEPAAPMRRFDVLWVRWAYDFGLGGLGTLATGRGLYEVGGEFAITQRLALDLAVGDEPVTRYDSGIVVGGSDTDPFPAIDLSISRNGQYCYDRVFTLHAKPVGSPRPPPR